jgi:mannosyltransferase OCH1-like enzyme
MLNKIPFKVHQTFYTRELPLDIITIIAGNKLLCPRYNFYFYDDDDCEIFIKNHYEENVYNAYMKLNKSYGAMKADFFRYCILYKVGGVYLDIKTKLNKSLASIIKPNDVCILDIPRNNLEPWRINNPTYEQWLLMFAPGHPYLKEMISQMVHNIENNYEPKLKGYKTLTSKQKVLLLTGPDAFTKAINSYINKNKIFHKHINYGLIATRHVGNYMIMYKDRKHYSQVNLPLYNW